MKTFKNHLNEKATDAGYPVDTDSFSNDLAKPENIERINSFLGAMGKLEYMVPEHAINKIKERLGRLAISFGDVDLSEAGGKALCPSHSLVDAWEKMIMVRRLMMMVSLTKLRVDCQSKSCMKKLEQAHIL